MNPTTTTQKTAAMTGGTSATESPVRLDDTFETVRREESFAIDGHGARSVVRTPDFRCVALAFRVGGTMAEHQVPRTSTLQVLRGRLRVRCATGELELAAGQLAILNAGVAHSLEALADTDAVLSFGWSDAGAAA